MSSTPHAPRLNERRPPDITVPPPGAWPPDPQTLPTAPAEGFQEAHTPNVDTQYYNYEHSIDEETDVQVVPCPRHIGKKRRPFFGVKKHANTTRSHQVNDPFNYEHKYPEDPPYQEMGPYARLWKAFLEESAKVDADKVADWTDALDVLLVFAGLFSAVVSTFLTQTFQKLEVDPNDVAVSLLYELCDLVRALNNKQSTDTIPRFKDSPASIFHPTRTATWVNGLWFVSLAISLTTALVAVVTKQWIHQYVASVNLGTPRERCRIRQFRYMNLQTWQVPLIIGLLPVLIHTALGLFFAGLVTLVLSLHTGIAIATSCVVGLALAIYTIANLLPVYNAACPYKTPLTKYTYPPLQRLYAVIHSSLAIIIPAQLNSSVAQVETNETPSSLEEAEKHIAAKRTDVIDSNVAAWLYSSSDNASVQAIVLQALSNIPLRCVHIVKEALRSYDIEGAIQSTLYSPEYLELGKRSAYERLTRSLVRLFPQTSITWSPPSYGRGQNFVPALLNVGQSELAVSFLQKEIVNPSMQLDVVVWAQVLRNALNEGQTWLQPEERDSVIWPKLLQSLLEPHTCPACIQRRGLMGNLCELPLGHHSGHARDGTDYADMSLKILDSLDPDVETIRPMSFTQALTAFMRPSLSDLVLHLTYRCSSETRFRSPMTNVRPSSIHESSNSGDASDVPSDIQLRLSLVQSYAVQTTSRLNSTSTFGRVITCIRSSIGIEDPDGAHIHHNGVLMATFTTLAHLVNSSAFDTDGILSWTDRKHTLQALLRTLLLESKSHAPYHLWISDFIICRIIQVAFTEDSCVAEDSPLLADLIEAAVALRCHLLLPTVYAHLRKREWLDVACSVRLHHGEDCYAGIVNDRSYHFMAAAFVRGMNVLQELESTEYEQTLKYVRKPSNLLSLGKLLMLSDIERRKELQHLVPFIEPSIWASFVSSLRGFVQSPNFWSVYEEQACLTAHPYEVGAVLTYDSFERLETALFHLAFGQRRPLYGKSSYVELMSQRLRQFSKRVAGTLGWSPQDVETDDKQDIV